MRILNFGSINIDYVYRVDQFVKPGETKTCQSLTINAGGKGLNQSIAAARAGNTVLHAGLIGSDGQFLADKLNLAGVNTSLMARATGVSGHAIIQVDDDGQNCILLYGGTNKQLDETYIDQALERFGRNGLVLLQNETNLVGYIIAHAHQRGLKIALNAAPYGPMLHDYPLDLLDWLIVNEVEGADIACCSEIDEILPALRARYPKLNILLTLGKRGARCLCQDQLTTIGSYQVQAVDTTAAGDTFTGYFLYGVLHDLPIEASLKLATAASALCVQKVGAADSIPAKTEVDSAIEQDLLGPLGRGV